MNTYSVGSFMQRSVVPTLILVFLLGSINNVTAQYLGALGLLIVGCGYLFVIPKMPLSTDERSLLLFWLLYPIVAAIWIFTRGPNEWWAFQEASRFLLIIPVFYLIRCIGVSQKVIAWGVLLAALVAGGIGLYQKFYLGLGRPFGGTNNFIAAYGNISLLLGLLTFVLWHEKFRGKSLISILVLIAAVLGIVGSIVSGNKGGWVSLPFMVWVMLDLRPNTKLTHKALVMVALLLAMLSVYFFLPFVQARMDVIVPALYEYFVNGVIYDGSAGVRLALWHAGIIAYLDSPLIGHGIDSYNTVVSGLVGEYPNFRSALRLAPHNQLVDGLVAYGLLGPLMIFGIYFSFIRYCYRHVHLNRNLAIAGVVLAVGFIDFGMFEMVWYRNATGNFFTFCMAIIAGQLAYLKRTADQSNQVQEKEC